MVEASDVLFEVDTPLGFRVHITRARWDLLVTIKHPIMVGRELEVRATLETPDEVHRSQSDSAVFLFYRTLSLKRWVRAVVKRTALDGFLITAYPTDAIKEGMRIWPK